MTSNVGSPDMTDAGDTDPETTGAGNTCLEMTSPSDAGDTGREMTSDVVNAGAGRTDAAG